MHVSAPLLDIVAYTGYMFVVVGRSLHSFPFQLNFSASVYRITRINS
jgi:hypothetical protein